MTSMDAEARRALTLIRKCVATERFILSKHFSQRMEGRGLVWPDILAALDRPSSVRHGGPERLNRPKWIVAGDTADGLNIEIVCVLDEDDRGDWVVFITVY